MVSAHSKAPEAAAELVRYLTSEEQQSKRAIALSLLPTLPSLYNDPDQDGVSQVEKLAKRIVR